MTKYKSFRIIDGKPKLVIVNENGKIVNDRPSKDEVKNLGDENYKRKKTYTDIELLNYLKEFYQENGRIPIMKDFVSNHKYPGYNTYQKRFGSWNNALKFVGMDIDTIVEQGFLLNNNHKARLFEILVRDTFDNKSIDLSGKNCLNTYDGICPNGQIYDAKASKLYIGGYWTFAIENKDKGEDKEAIQWYYFGAFNEDYTKLMHVWRVPGDIIEGNSFRVGIHSGEFNVENMKEYEITDKFRKVAKEKLKRK